MANQEEQIGRFSPTSQQFHERPRSKTFVAALGKEGEPKGEVASATNSSAHSEVCPISSLAERAHSVLDEEQFHHAISLERKRTERSGNPFLLMLLSLDKCVPGNNDQILEKLLLAVPMFTRDTDVTGWYRNHSVVGVMFTEISSDGSGSNLTAMVSRLTEGLHRNLGPDQFSRTLISFHAFPKDLDDKIQQGNAALYPDVVFHDAKVARIVKRLMDIVGSAAALILLSPLFLMIAVAVKLSTKGPIFFKQERLGRFCKTFSFLKFRSMYADNDHKIHRDFMKRVIKGEYDGRADGESKSVYKMTSDPRITRIGRILRKSSLDELPQFINVLKGDMSLVGPRPPVAYEYQEYDIWHRRRVLEMKPGITGLWQVQGRSRIGFDDMVRLDLQYLRTWSLWLDILILMRTPRAVLRHHDAF